MSDRSRSRSRSRSRCKSKGSDDGSGDEEIYEVEEIRDKRRGEDGDWLYYVKWVSSIHIASLTVIYLSLGGMG